MYKRQLTIHSAGWGIFFNIIFTGFGSYFFPDSDQKNLDKEKRHAFLSEVAGVPKSKKKLVPLAYGLVLFWFLFGFGPFAGFIALSIGTIGFYAKLLAEDIENMSEDQAEAIKATGASWFQWINYAIQPQVMPRMIGLSVYRLDINFRESAVVGIVGGGGIGATLNTAFDRYEFDTAAAILLIIIGIVMCLEYFSGFLRKRVQ